MCALESHKILSKFSCLNIFLCNFPSAEPGTLIQRGLHQKCFLMDCEIYFSENLCTTAYLDVVLAHFRSNRIHVQRYYGKYQVHNSLIYTELTMRNSVTSIMGGLVPLLLTLSKFGTIFSDT